MRISLQLLSLLSIPIPFNSFIYNNKNAIILRKPLRTSSCLLKANNKTSHIYKINFNNNNDEEEFNSKQSVENAAENAVATGGVTEEYKVIKLQ